MRMSDFVVRDAIVPAPARPVASGPASRSRSSSAGARPGTAHVGRALRRRSPLARRFRSSGVDHLSVSTAMPYDRDLLRFFR